MFMTQHWREHPSVEQVAAQVNVSPAHFTRLFSHWAGISPKQYLRLLTLDEAKRELSAGQDLLAASQSIGLSGPGRLHDLFVDIEAVTPGQFKNGGEGVVIRHGWIDTDFGLCHVAATDRGLCSVSFHDQKTGAALALLGSDWPRAKLLEDQQVGAPVISALSSMATGSRPERLRVVVQGTNFQVQVWRALLRVPLGKTQSYSDIARELGREGGARAVGAAVGANRIGYLIPCHRILRAGGGLGGYRWGEARKQTILAWEKGRANCGLMGTGAP
jgi:AraC family transcriptional regulator of adaptative response/methylated-DNA-[protein]-cysteine methyltransferase